MLKTFAPICHVLTCEREICKTSMECQRAKERREREGKKILSSGVAQSILEVLSRVTSNNPGGMANLMFDPSGDLDGEFHKTVVSAIEDALKEAEYRLPLTLKEEMLHVLDKKLPYPGLRIDHRLEDFRLQAIEKALGPPVATVAEVHMGRYTLEWSNGPVPEGTPLYRVLPESLEGGPPESRALERVKEPLRDQVWTDLRSLREPPSSSNS